MAQREVTIFVDGNELEVAGLFDGDELSGTETELVISTVGAIAKGKKPATVKALVASNQDVPANGQLDFAIAGNGTIALNVPRAGKYLGIKFTLGPGEEFEITNADINSDDILAREAQAAIISGTGITVAEGMRLEGGNAEPTEFFMFFDKKGKKPIDMTPNDKVNVAFNNDSGAALKIPYQFCTALPRDVRFIN